jgi:hypothetical protein
MFISKWSNSFDQVDPCTVLSVWLIFRLQGTPSSSIIQQKYPTKVCTYIREYIVADARRDKVRGGS